MNSKLKVFSIVWLALGGILTFGGGSFLMVMTFVLSSRNKFPEIFHTLGAVQVAIGLCGVIGGTLVLRGHLWAKWILIAVTAALPVHIIFVASAAIKQVATQ